MQVTGRYPRDVRRAKILFLTIVSLIICGGTGALYAQIDQSDQENGSNDTVAIRSVAQPELDEYQEIPFDEQVKVAMVNMQRGLNYERLCVCGNDWGGLFGLRKNRV